MDYLFIITIALYVLVFLMSGRAWVYRVGSNCQRIQALTHTKSRTRYCRQLYGPLSRWSRVRS